MSEIPEGISIHRLSMNKKKKPVRLKKRNHALEWQKAIDKEMEKFLTAGFIFETKSSDNLLVNQRWGNIPEDGQ